MLKPLKCELCGEEFEPDNIDFEELESLRETGRCLNCCEEWGDQYPDRV